VVGQEKCHAGRAGEKPWVADQGGCLMVVEAEPACAVPAGCGCGGGTVGQFRVGVSHGGSDAGMSVTECGALNVPLVGSALPEVCCGLADDLADGSVAERVRRQV